MLWSAFIVSLVIALVLTAVAVGVIGWRRPSMPARTGFLASAAFLFLLVFFATWAVGMWIAPQGPLVYGVPWLSLLVVGVVVSLIVLAAAPAPRGARRSRGALSERDATALAALSFGALFWTALLILILAALFGALA